LLHADVADIDGGLAQALASDGWRMTAPGAISRWGLGPLIARACT